MCVCVFVHSFREFVLCFLIYIGDVMVAVDGHVLAFTTFFTIHITVLDLHCHVCFL